jgi:hypothetical protein
MEFIGVVENLITAGKVHTETGIGKISFYSGKFFA